MISDFFIQRPVLANVLAILMIVIGAVALFALPVAQYPDVVPPTVQVITRYPGASARTVVDAVALPIEQQVNGVEGMIYMQSFSAADGSYSLTVTFRIGVDLNVAQILVQNRVSSALASLPQAVQAQGVVVQKNSTAILQIVTLASPDQRYDSLYLANYATIKLKDEIARLPGVGNVVVFGAGQYSMRIWLDPNKMQARGLVPQDIVQALQQQSSQVTAGQIGAPPAPSGQTFQYTLNVEGKLSDPAQFADVIVKTGRGGEITRLGDVGRVELGSQTYGQVFTLDGKPAAGLAIFQAPGANALNVANEVRGKMAVLAREFPQGLVSDIPFDTTRFVEQSIHEVYKTLYEAAILVLVVILLFLQDWRAMLIPATTVPVTIIGAFAAMAALGFTINFSTLFAIVLAIGIVVDDAIVVVEGAVHNIEKGMPGREAASEAMRLLFGPIIGITLVLMSVFLPAAFLPGLTGRMYAQFALVIAATALLSAINAATLKPTQAAMWLRPAVPPERRNIFYRAFNGAYGRIERWYASLIAGMVHCHRIRVLAGSDRLPADRGPRLYDRAGAIARWLIARAHTEGIGSGLRTQPQDSGGRPGDHHRWSVAARQQRPAVECRRRLYLVEGLERARQGRGSDVAFQESERDPRHHRGGRYPGDAPAADPGRRQRRRLHHADPAARRQLRHGQAAGRHQRDR
jgi:HAE1 family hydrophobic/amphiphilic exporter-1